MTCLRLITNLVLIACLPAWIACNEELPEKQPDVIALQQIVHRNIPWMEGKVHFYIDTKTGVDSSETFSVKTIKDELHITANSRIAAATGLNWYLKYYCHNNLSHTGNNINSLPELPLITDSLVRKSDYRYRYALNYCTLNYTMSFWDWPRWEKELDWMAMNGINLLLAPIGNEYIWYNVLSKLGFNDSLSLSYAPGPAFTAWWLMGNLEGWQGPLSKDFIKKQAILQQQILTRCSELGIEPVLQGFYGIVPSFLKKRFPHANIIEQGKWEGGFERSAFLDPADTLFAKMSNLYYSEIQNLYGNNFRFFGGDPFHEGGKTGGLDLTKSGKLIYNAVADHYPGAVWILQAWQGNPKPSFLSGFEKGQALVLDLFGESDNYWEQRKGYEDHPWLWCMINNFGEKTGMIGKLQRAVKEPLRAKTTYSGRNMKGIGIIPEGINNNAVLYDLILEMAWRQKPVDLISWIKNYSFYRYGIKDERLENAWQLLLQSVYSSPENYNILGPVESVMLAKPSLNVTKMSSWGNVKLFYDTILIKNAAEEFVNAAPEYWHIPSFRYDCIDICRQLLSDRSLLLYARLKESYITKKAAEFQKTKSAFLDLILQQDSLCSLDTSFTLAHWLNQAKALGNSEKEKKQFVRNAKVQISYWGPDNSKSSLIDYAGKQWSGMLRTYYYDRWKIYLNTLGNSINRNNFSNKEPDIDYFRMAKKWCENDNPYTEGTIVKDRKRFLERIISK